MTKEERKGKRRCERLVLVWASFALAVGLLVAAICTKQVNNMAAEQTNQGKEVINQASIDYEITEKRGRFTKQFALSDGTFLAVSYSMPVHEKKKGKWSELDTTMKKVIRKKAKTYYRTKRTDLAIHMKAQNLYKKKPQKLVSLSRDKKVLSLTLLNKKQRNVKAVVSNPKKSETTDVLNENKVRYSGILKNINLIYDIYPERITERVVVKKKAKKIPSFTFRLDVGKLKTKEKNGRLFFTTKKGKVKYKRLKTILTDAKGVSTTKAKITYNKKKLTVKPDKAWWSSKKRKFPITIRTSYVTEKHEREVQVGASYAGSSDSNFTYDTALLSKAGTCTPFIKMTYLTELSNPNVRIREANLHLKNEQTLKMGAGNTFNMSIHRVTEKWKGGTLSYQNRPKYEKEASATCLVSKRGRYTCDITELVKQWYQGVPNEGMALVADNTNGSYQARLGRNPYIALRYEIVGFDGAVRLTENQEITRDVVSDRQENYYFFDTKPGIAYDLYTTSDLDTQGTLYHENKERFGFDDNSGVGNNFAFVGSYNGRKFLKVMTKGTGTGQYKLMLKKRFEVPVVKGEQTADGYRLTWEEVKPAKEYVITVTGENGVVETTVAQGTAYEYIYTEKTRGKILAFTVTPRENESLVGEPSLRIFNTNPSSEWNYETPLKTARASASAASFNKKIYVLGGESEEKGTALKSMEVYDTKMGTWSKATDYPGNVTGICHAKMLPIGEEIYVFGGQTDTTANAVLIREVYAYSPKKDTWTKKADMPDGRTGVVAAKYKSKVYMFSKIGTTKRIDCYNLKTDTWEEPIVSADTSCIINAVTINNRIFLLQSKASDGLEEEIYVQEYLPEENDYEEPGKNCPIAGAGRYTQACVIDGTIYFASTGRTDHVIEYDVYRDEWSKTSVFHLEKEDSALQAAGDTIYNIGGLVRGFGVVDVVESFKLPELAVKKTLEAIKGESYELQLAAGNMPENAVYTVTITIDPELLAFRLPSSFVSEEEFREGKNGIQLIRYEPDKGVMVLRIDGKMETGTDTLVLQSIPVDGIGNGIAGVSMKADKED